MRIIRTSDSRFEEVFRQIAGRGRVFEEELWKTVYRIVRDVAERGDDALFAYTEQFDGYRLAPGAVAATPGEIDAAVSAVSPEEWKILHLSAERIERYHRRQILPDLRIDDEEGVLLEQRVLPLERVGVYAPGGLAAYPSTVLMAAIPARIAGVKEILLASPAREGRLHPLIAAAAKLCGITQILKIGGGQAIAALAYGTASVPRVDKIVGPGNAFVAAAKRIVFGEVSIDMIAGPSEVLIVADGSAPASFAAADLIAQAEHDEMASAVLVTPDARYASQVAAEVDRLVDRLSRREILVRSLERFGAIFLVENLEEAAEVANRFAPEHLELMVANPRHILPWFRHAGSIFLGAYAPEAIGDYLAGPNHILPTGGTARFSSPLGVYDFLKRTSVLEFSPEAFGRYGTAVEAFAGMEGLTGHGLAASIRGPGALSDHPDSR
ncbi:MAG: histidinol dehydrogenase [Syntrophaceae bacterium]|nr:histidinol dehydrogenase [Syntrophaceae bacterium]